MGRQIHCLAIKRYYCGLYWRTHQYMVCLRTNSKAIKIIKIIADPHNPIKNACAVVIQHIDILRFLRLLDCRFRLVLIGVTLLINTGMISCTTTTKLSWNNARKNYTDGTANTPAHTAKSKIKPSFFHHVLHTVTLFSDLIC